MSEETSYTSFLGSGHTSGGHWNDPPSQIFKLGDEKTSPTENLTNSTVQIYERLLIVLTNLPPQPKRPDYPRRIKDVGDRIQLLSQLELDSPTTVNLTQLVERMEKGELNEALQIHTKMMLENYGGNSKWLIGLKRLIELLQG